MTGFTSEFDNDTIDQHQENIFEEITNEKLIEVTDTDTLGLDEQEELTLVIEAEENDTSVQSFQIEQNDWSKNCVDKLRTPVSTKLAVNHPKDIRKRDNTLKTKLTNWAKAKQDCVSIQQQCILDECKQKLRLNEEKHQEDLKQKREIHEKNMVMIQEEHEVKISILKLQRQKLLKELSD
ncbi:hypothetical protein JTB14_010803 [Gonioctena quinquepunctata]|nr:hypothetical protein JTB14_010803 [Gonioctena quinquepunctata]